MCLAQADQLGRVAEALTAYTECVEACDAALATHNRLLQSTSAKAISKVKDQSQARITHMQMQSKRTILVRAMISFAYPSVPKHCLCMSTHLDGLNACW